MIEIVVNLMHNMIPVSKHERQTIMKNFHVIQRIAAIRDVDEARQALLKHGQIIIKSVLPSVFLLCGNDRL